MTIIISLYANVLCVLLKKPVGLKLEYDSNDQGKFDKLGLKSNLSNWKCYEFLNVPGITLKFHFYNNILCNYV